MDKMKQIFNYSPVAEINKYFSKSKRKKYNYKEIFFNDTIIPEKNKKSINIEDETEKNKSTYERNPQTINVLRKGFLKIETENFCTLFYNKRKKKMIKDTKMLMYEKMCQGVKEKVKELMKNDVIKRKTQIKINKEIDNGNLSQSVNKSNDKKIECNTTDYKSDDFLKHYYDEFKPRKISRNFVYENYAFNYPVCKHNQIYNLKINSSNNQNLPTIKTNYNSLNHFSIDKIKDISLSIPERIENNERNKIETYNVFRIMKNNIKRNFMI